MQGSQQCQCLIRIPVAVSLEELEIRCLRGARPTRERTVNQAARRAAPHRTAPRRATPHGTRATRVHSHLVDEVACDLHSLYSHLPVCTRSMAAQHTCESQARDDAVLLCVNPSVHVNVVVRRLQVAVPVNFRSRVTCAQRHRVHACTCIPRTSVNEHMHAPQKVRPAC